MNVTRISLILVFGLTVLLSGCKKNTVEPQPPAQNPQTLNDLKAPDSFNWSTGSTVEVKITGLPTVLPVKNTLKISLNDGRVIFSRLHTMSEDLSVKITVPSTENKLILKYGTLTQSADIMSGQALFSFIPTVED
jgi:hypothetical protein